MSNNFWDRVEEFKKLGADPLAWLASGTCEVDPSIKSAAAPQVHKAGLKLVPSWFDSYYYVDGKQPELTRRVFDAAEEKHDTAVDIKRALAMFRLQKDSCEDAAHLASALGTFFKPFSTKLAVSSMAIAATQNPDAQFALLDYIELHRGDKAGFMPAVSTVAQVTDVFSPPGAELQAAIPMTSCIDMLSLLGCGINSSFRLFPVYDAPGESMLDSIRANLDSYTSRHNLAWEDYSSLKRSKLFYGCSAMAVTIKELPTRYDLVEEGMQIMITKSLGGLAALTLRVLGAMSPDNLEEYEKSGITAEALESAASRTIKNLTEPHFILGKIVSKYCPDFGGTLDKSANIAAVYPVGPQGISALPGLAQALNCQLVINEIPLLDPEISACAARDSLVEDSTASLNGCHIIVASKEVVDLVRPELSSHGFAPAVIGFVGKKGAPSVAIDQESVKRLVPSVRRQEAIFAVPNSGNAEQVQGQPAASGAAQT